MAEKMKTIIPATLTFIALTLLATNVFAWGAKELENEKDAIVFSAEVARGHYKVVSTPDVISALEEEVIRSLKEEDLLARNINQAYDEQLTLGERVADKVAEFGGSWKFIICFGGTIVLWITINSILALRRPFDPYPYILLNLVLSCLAAVQAPIIMMSQNRQAKKDRIMVDHDYRTNLKAELEVRQLNRKVDQLLMHNWQRLLDIQRVQTELMEEIARKNQDTKSAE